MSRVFVTGGSGVIGTALVRSLRARGDQVVALARGERSATKLAACGAEVVRGDALDEQALVEGMRGCELAFNVAGVNSLCVRDPEPMWRMNAHQPALAVKAARRAEVRRLVHTSSAATIGEPPGCIGTEQTVHRGWYLSTYEQTKTEGERAALAAARQLGQDLVCVNPSSVQGPGRSGGTARFLLALLDGRLRVFVKTNVSLVDIEDCVRGHLLAAERGASGERYLLSGVTLSLEEAIALASEVCGVAVRPHFVPPALASAAATVIERAFALARRRAPICREMVATLLHGHRYDGSRAVRELGLSYTDPRQTLLRTAAWARSQGLLRGSGSPL